MADIVSAAIRSRMMAGIRSSNTTPERILRKALFARGFRYRLDNRHVPGKPDIVLPRYNAVIFCHGCFWHGHACHLFRLPQTRTDFWRTKIDGNRARDARTEKILVEQGWRIATVYECAMKGRSSIGLDAVADRCAAWLRSNRRILQISGRAH